MALLNLVLIGFRGTGKSEIGRLLAKRLRYTFVDTDEEVTRRAGMDIARIFQEKGERYFRDLETAVVLRYGNLFAHVIACGGGVVMREGNVEILKRLGKLVWLTASAETIHRRLMHDPKSATQRPNLTPAGGLEEIRMLLASRRRHYRDAADVTIKTDGKTPRQVVQEVLQYCRMKVVNDHSSGLSFPLISGDEAGDLADPNTPRM